MREIKFRGKAVSNCEFFDKGDWVYGYYFYDFAHNLAKIKTRTDVIPVGEGSGLVEVDIVVDRKTVGQLIDLKDKNGKEIYEGDIVKISSKYFRVLRINKDQEEDRVGSVWHDNELSCFNIGDIRWNVIPRKDLSKRYYEVIGNIYENPELLEGRA